MLKANMESDHIRIFEEFDTTIAKISDGKTYNEFVEAFCDASKGMGGSILCMSSMDFPFESTTSMDLVMLANQFTGNTISTPDHYYQPIPDIRDANGIGEFCYWIMEENGKKAYPDILPENWLCYDEDEIGEGVKVVLMDAIPSTLELKPA